MQPELGRGLVQRVWVAWLAGREVALFDVRVPGETLHLVCAAGLGVGAVDGERRGQLREAMRRGSISPAQVGWRKRFEGARAQAGTPGHRARARGPRGRAARRPDGPRGARAGAPGVLRSRATRATRCGSPKGAWPRATSAIARRSRRAAPPSPTRSRQSASTIAAPRCAARSRRPSPGWRDGSLPCRAT